MAVDLPLKFGDICFNYGPKKTMKWKGKMDEDDKMAKGDDCLLISGNIKNKF